MFDDEFITKHGFEQFWPIKDFWSANRVSCSSIPDKPGLYIVVSPEGFTIQFERAGTGGFFRHRDPNVGINVLRDNLVDDSRILYIGRAGGTTSSGVAYKSTLRRRVPQFLRFGRGEPVPHWGGRLIWQIGDNEELLVGCRVLEDGNTVQYEHQLLAEYLAHYGKLPFANLVE